MSTEPQKKTRRQMLEEFLTANQADAFSRYGLALEYMNAGDTAAAETHFRKLLEFNPGYVPAYLIFGQMLARNSRPAEARQILQSGISAAAARGDSHARSEMEALLAELS